ncbi:restriction endonuclease subunit S [Phormidium sp. FACHB-1136]|uniref:restriction endonuclease subunit S n=1 Tax=Phormidium sp. FACHB-1136 TaxID=2692848 RepID=UPI001688BDAB|nr:restriction endonuclease subunit S [Phormidium sp. FACHB-1136]MBD2429544.1 restriction endonuclease subunit S [Phormidium sp. FACHB-1136]
MNLKTFFEHFDTLAEAPNGIQRLRELILDMAVRGKLVPQDPEDKPASIILDKIQKKRLASRKRYLQPKSIDPLVCNGTLFDLPQLWEWCRVGDIANVCLGGTPSRQDPTYWNGSIPWVSSGEVANCVIYSTKEQITAQGLANSNAKVYPKGTVLIAIIGQGKTRGQSAILGIEACTNQNIVGLVFETDDIFPNYVWKWALSIYESSRSVGRGGAQPALNCQKIRDLFFPLPPLAEQKRIVVKVDELMALCDALEAAQQTRNTLRQKLRASALDGLMNAPSNTDLETAWAFVRDNWELMCDRPEDVEGLRKSILQMAVRGRLVPQNSKDEPASKLASRIEAESKRPIQKEKINNSEQLTQVIASKKFFSLPNNWLWVRCEEITTFVTSGSRGWAEHYSSRGSIFLRIGNLDYSSIEVDLTSLQFVDPPAGAEGLRTKIETDDLLVSITGDTGMIGLARPNLPKAYINQHIALVRLSKLVFSECISC